MSEVDVHEPLAAGTPAMRPALPDLILLRLLPAKQSVAPKRLRADLAVFFGHPPTAGRIAEAVAALRAEGFVTAKGQQATGEGRARALQYLGVDSLPPRAHWGTVKAKYLVPRALGLPLDAGAVRDGKKLAAHLLKRKLALPVATGDTLNAVFEAIACRALGFRDHATLKSLVPLLLAKEMGSDAVLDMSDAEKVVPRVLLRTGPNGANGLRASALGGWADGTDVPPAPDTEPEAIEEPFDLEMFANTVKKVARTCPTGRFGGYKVFISHVWDQLRDEPRFARLGLAGFKARLVEANRANLLTLSRADLVQLMDPADVRASETTYLTATFHFILVEGS